MADAAIDSRVAKLQQLLKPSKGGAAPAPAAVAVAIELALGNKEAIKSLPVGGARTRANKMAARMRDEGMLDIASTSATADPIAVPSMVHPSLSSCRPLPTGLLVQDNWIHEN